MAIGDHLELLSMSALDDQVQVWCTWEETGTTQSHGGTHPSYVLYSVRVVNETPRPQTFLVTAGVDQTQWWFSINPGGLTHVLTAAQRAKTDGGVSISLAAS